MERLTFEGNFCEISRCEGEYRMCSWCENGACDARKVWERLKAYEDIGLTPEEIIDRLAKAKVAGMFEAEAEKAFDKLIEYQKAEQEGRLVVLPCKVGDTVYGVTRLKKLDGSIVNELKHGKVLVFKILASGIFCEVSAEEQYGYPVAWKLEDFAKLWFLTSEEAEAALEEDKP